MKKLEKNEMKIKLVEGNVLNVVTIGSGQPVLCVSGFGCDHYIFEDIANTLGSEYQFIIIDNRGMGGSDASPSSFTLKDLANDSVFVMDHLGFNKFHLIGISMGGLISQLIARDFSNRLISLSLLCTLGLGEDFIPLTILTDDQLQKFYNGEPIAAISMAVALTTHPNTDKTTIDHITNKRLEHKEKLENVLLQRDAVVNYFLKETIDYNQMNLPTLILTGDQDRTVDPENSKKLNRKIKNSKLKIINETDHYFFMEKTKDVSLEIQTFLNQFKGSAQ